MTTQPAKILVVLTGSIAAYKVLDVMRQLIKSGHHITTVMTKGAMQFLTPMAVSALTGERVYTPDFNHNDESTMGHIALARAADLVLVAPASADFLAKMRMGLADDLASTLLLVNESPVVIAPAMNPSMWHHAATQDNVNALKGRGVNFITPDVGVLACGEEGRGRLSSIENIVEAVEEYLPKTRVAPSVQNNPFIDQPLSGKKAIVTAGPTREALDPVRYLTNASSGKQGYAIAASLQAYGAEVTLVSGPTELPAPLGVDMVPVTSAKEMAAAVQAALPADIAICSAAVSDWYVPTPSKEKLKKQKDQNTLTLELAKTPDILAMLGTLPATKRPALIVGFAAETEKLLEHATKKLQNKHADWMVANDVSGKTAAVPFGQDHNTVTVLDKNGERAAWQNLPKTVIASALVEEIVTAFHQQQTLTKAS